MVLMLRVLTKPLFSISRIGCASIGKRYALAQSLNVNGTSARLTEEGSAPFCADASAQILTSARLAWAECAFRTGTEAATRPGLAAIAIPPGLAPASALAVALGPFGFVAVELSVVPSASAAAAAGSGLANFAGIFFVCHFLQHLAV